MKNKKYKIIFLILTITISIIVTSCEKENAILEKNQDLENLVLKSSNFTSLEKKHTELDEKNNLITTKEVEIEIEESDEITDEYIEELVNGMTLEEKVGQMFIVVPETFSQYSEVTDINQLDIEEVEKYNIGGFILFTKNINNPTQLTDLTENLADINEEIGMFISTDEEGGQVGRISNNSNFPDKSFPNMNEIGATEDYGAALVIGDTIGKYLSKYGVNLNFAPVCDVLLNQENTVVSKRSFSSDANVVAGMSLNVMKGLKSNNILACAKHFPGHGNTSLDTHDGFATSNATLEEMKSSELIPFVHMIENDVDMIMISHVIYPNLSSEQVPATLNYDIITGLLKEDLGYKGVVITDGMNMGAISNNYSVSNSTVKAVKAGVDIVLMPSDFYIAYNSVIDAVSNGEISEERINKSVTKILKLKLDKIKT